jgi:hypothetical protein
MDPAVRAHHDRFKQELDNFFALYDDWCKIQYQNTIDIFHNEIGFGCRAPNYNYHTQVYQRVTFVDDLNDDPEDVEVIWFDFSNIDIDNVNLDAIDFDYVHRLVFESLKEKTGTAQYAYRMVTDPQRQELRSIRGPQWSELTHYSVPMELNLPAHYHETFRLIFDPIRQPLWNCIQSFRNFHFTPAGSSHLDSHMNQHMWEAINRITDVAELVMNKRSRLNN